MHVKRVALLLFSTLVITALPAPAFAAGGFPKGTFLIKTGNKCVEYVAGEFNNTLEMRACSTKYNAKQVWQVTDGSVRLAGQLRNVGSATRCAFTSPGSVGPVTCLPKGSTDSQKSNYLSTVTSSKTIKTTATSDGKTSSVCWGAKLDAPACTSGSAKFTFPKPPAR